MKRIMLLPITLPLRVAALQLRLARGAAEAALDLTRDLAEAAPWARPDGDERADEAARPERPTDAAAAGADLAEPARQARRRAAVQRTRARRTAGTEAGAAAPRPTRARKPPAAADAAPAAAPRPTRARKPPAAADATPAAAPRPTRVRKPPAAAAPTPPAVSDDDKPRPRPRRAARKATAGRPARERESGPTRGEVAAIREAQRESEGQAAEASSGPTAGAGPEVRIEPPWEGYDEMALHEVLARLEGADETLVAAVRLYEGRNESRQAILLATETD
jgi:hypothetical protein